MLMTEWQQFGYQYNSSQAVSHEICDFFALLFLIWNLLKFFAREAQIPAAR